MMCLVGSNNGDNDKTGKSVKCESSGGWSDYEIPCETLTARKVTVKPRTLVKSV